MQRAKTSKLHGVISANLIRLMKWSAPALDLKTPTAAARHAGIDQTTVNRILKGETSPRIDALEAIAAAFGLEAWHILLPIQDEGIYNLLRAYNKADADGRKLLMLAAEAASKSGPGSDTTGKH